MSVSLIRGMVFLFIAFTILGFMSEGGGGLVVTNTTSGITNAQTTIPVTSTDGFLVADKLVIGTETVIYSGKTLTSFTGVVRGAEGSSPESHLGGSNVYTESAGVVNSLLGFNFASTNSAFGFIKLITYAPLAFTTGVSHIILFNYPMFDGSLIWLKYLFFTVEAIGLVWIIFWSIVQSFLNKA